MTSDTRMPSPEVRGVGKVLYRCAACGELMEPDAAVVIGDRSFHLEHAPETTDGL